MRDEDVADLDPTCDLERRSATRARIAVAHLCRLDRAIGFEVTAVHEVHDMAATLVRTRDPRRGRDDQWVEQEADARRARQADRTGTDVALDECGVLGEVLVRERLDLRWTDLCFQPLEVDIAVARHADDQRFEAAVGMVQLDDDVLQGVGRGPVAIRVAQVGSRVHQIDQRLDRRRLRRVFHMRGRHVLADSVRWRLHLDRFRVRRVVAVRAAHERVLADLERREELLRCGAAHRAGHRRHDHVGQAEPVERAHVRDAVRLVRHLQAGIVDVERVRVLHRELAPSQQPGARPRLVTELPLDLVDRERQVLVGRVEVLHEQREHLLVRRREQEVRAASVLQAEEVVAVVRPPTARLVRLTRQQRGEVHLLEAGAIHLLAHDPFHVAVDDPTEREPGEAPRCDPADVAAAHEQAVARHLGVDRSSRSVRTNREDMRITRGTRASYLQRRSILRGPYLVRSPKRRGLLPTPCFVNGPGER